MKQFFTKSTVEASVFCKPCGKKTQWEVIDGRPLHCEECFKKLKEKSSEIAQEKQDTFNFNS